MGKSVTIYRTHTRNESQNGEIGHYIPYAYRISFIPYIYCTHTRNESQNGEIAIYILYMETLLYRRHTVGTYTILFLVHSNSLL
jgi:hypothetical protein